MNLNTRFLNLFIYALCFLSSLACASNNLLEDATHVSKLPVLTEVIPGEVYTCAGLTHDNKPLYFGMERVNQSSQYKWNSYKRASEMLTGHYFSKVSFSEENRRSNPTFYSDYEQQAYDAFCDSVINKMSSKNDLELSNLRRDINTGLSGFTFCLDDGLFHEDTFYVAYISKTPVTGYFQHPRYDTSIFLPKFSLKKYHESYQNLLMSIRCCDIADSFVYNNRGICKSLDCFINNDYKGLSLKLHAFTALVFDQKGKTHMSVAPIATMLNILKKAINEDKLMIEEHIPDHLNFFIEYSNVCDTRCVIDIETLKSKF